MHVTSATTGWKLPPVAPTTRSLSSSSMQEANLVAERESNGKVTPSEASPRAMQAAAFIKHTAQDTAVVAAERS